MFDAIVAVVVRDVIKQKVYCVFAIESRNIQKPELEEELCNI